MKEVEATVREVALDKTYRLQPEEVRYIKANATLYGTKIPKNIILYNDTPYLKKMTIINGNELVLTSANVAQPNPPEKLSGYGNDPLLNIAPFAFHITGKLYDIDGLDRLWKITKEKFFLQNKPNHEEKVNNDNPEEMPLLGEDSQSDS